MNSVGKIRLFCFIAVVLASRVAPMEVPREVLSISNEFLLMLLISFLVLFSASTTINAAPTGFATVKPVKNAYPVPVYSTGCHCQVEYAPDRKSSAECVSTGSLNLITSLFRAVANQLLIMQVSIGRLDGPATLLQMFRRQWSDDSISFFDEFHCHCVGEHRPARRHKLGNRVFGHQ